MKLIWTLFIFLISGPSLVFAQSAGNQMSQNLEPSSVLSKTDYLQVGGRLENFDYNEPGMTEKGVLVGVAGQYQHVLASQNSLQLNFELLTGRTDYNGATWGGDPVTSSNQFAVFELEPQFVWKDVGGFVPSLSPLVGLGLRGTAQDKESGGDYRREYYYLYATLGWQKELSVGKRTKMFLRMQENILVGGYNNTHLSDVGPDMPDVVLNFKSGSAYRLETEWNYRMDNQKLLTVALNYSAWNIDQSESAELGGGQIVFEPSNQTYLMGLNLGLQF